MKGASWHQQPKAAKMAKSSMAEGLISIMQHQRNMAAKA